MTSSAQAAHPEARAARPSADSWEQSARATPGRPPPHLLLSGGLLARNSGEGPLLFSAKSMAICMSSTHFSISARELEKRRASGSQTTAGRGASGQEGPVLPGGHDDGLALAPQREAVGHAPLIFTPLDLWGERSKRYCQGASTTLGTLSDAHGKGRGSEKQVRRVTRKGGERSKGTECFPVELIHCPGSDLSQGAIPG